MHSSEASNPLTPEQEAEISELAQSQGLIPAIKRYRDLTNVGLAEAKAAVETLVAAPPKMGSAPSSQPPLPGRPGALAVELEVELKDMLRQGAKIAAIKRYREAFPGLGLKEAKEAVEALAQKHGIVVKTSPCFVATAVFEDAAAPEVAIFRHWRDTRLILSRTGRCFIKTYSVLGPWAAILPRHSPALRQLLRQILGHAAKRLGHRQTPD